MTKRARLDADPLDAACRALRGLARSQNVYAIEVFVRADGRVRIIGSTASGYTKWHSHADLEPGSAHPLPSEALREVVGG